MLASINASLEISELEILPIQREHDQYIMEIATESGAFHKHEIRYINYCRYYLYSAITVADITNATGDAIINGIDKGQ